MIEIRLRQLAKKKGIQNAYQFQKFTGFPPAMAARLWREQWNKADLKTLNTLCILLKCTPGDLLKFNPDPEI